MRKKLLIMVEWFAPGFKAGGPIKSCLNIALALKNEYDIYVFTTDTDHGEKQAYADITTNKWLVDDALNMTIFYAEKSQLSLKQIAREINLINPDFIYLNLLFSPHFVIFPIWLKYKNRIRGQLVLSPRGALYDSALSLKWYKKKLLLLIYQLIKIERLVVFHATNERENQAIKKIFKKNKTIIANNLPNIYQPANIFPKKIIGEINCIFIARIVPIKNLLYILNCLQNVEAKVNFSIVGPAENMVYWNECKSLILTLPKNITVIYLGAKNTVELVDLVQQNHLFILPTTGENFGHAIFESFLAGRPVLISDQTPWLNLPALNIGWDLPLNNQAAFVGAIQAAANWTQDDFNTRSNAAWRYATEFINQPALIKPYYQLFS